MAKENVTNEQIFALLERTSLNVEDIKQELASYKERIEELESVAQRLQTENDELKHKVEIQETIIKRRNILVFGLPESEESLEQIVLDFLSKRLKIKINLGELDNYYRIGDKASNKTRPILIKFVREVTANRVFKHVKNLKGSGISIAQDLPLEKRLEKKILYDFLKVAKEKKFAAKIQQNKLIINKDEYTVETLKTLDKCSFLEPLVNKATLFPIHSAPPTPTIEHKQQDSTEDDEVFEIVDQGEEEVVSQTVEPVKDKTQGTKETRSKTRTRTHSTANNIQTNIQTPTSTKTRVASGSNNHQANKRTKK